jgi:hypothetical protein
VVRFLGQHGTAPLGYPAHYCLILYILVYPPLGACGDNVFRHLLVQHGTAPLGYPAHYCLILNQDHLSHVNLLLSIEK